MHVVSLINYIKTFKVTCIRPETKWSNWKQVEKLVTQFERPNSHMEQNMEMTFS